MNYSATQRDGSARDAALKRRNGAMREALGEGTTTPKQETEMAIEPKADEKPSE